MVIESGKGDAPAGLWPPHAGKNNNKKMTAIAAHEAKRKLPMHPLVAFAVQTARVRLTGMETCSVEAGDGFSKPRCLVNLRLLSQSDAKGAAADACSRLVFDFFEPDISQFGRLRLTESLKFNAFILRQRLLI